MNVLFEDPRLQRIATGTEFPGHLPPAVAKSFQAIVVWMECSYSESDALTLATSDGAVHLHEGFLFSFRIESGSITVIEVSAPVRSV